MQGPQNSVKKNPWGWSGAGLMAGVLVATLVYAPADWLGAWVQRISDDRIELVNARGTVWSGSAQMVFSGGKGSRDAVQLPGAVQWDLVPAWTSLGVQFRADCCTEQPLAVQVTPTGWGKVQLQVADGHSRWPAAMLAGLGTPWNTVQPQGQLEASSEGLALQWTQGTMNLAGRLQIDAMQISSQLSTLQPMGNYRVTVLGGGTSTLRLETLEGSSLQLSGDGRWLGANLSFEGVASASAEQVDALSNLLNIVGRRDGARSIIKVG